MVIINKYSCINDRRYENKMILEDFIEKTIILFFKNTTLAKKRGNFKITLCTFVRITQKSYRIVIQYMIRHDAKICSKDYCF